MDCDSKPRRVLAISIISAWIGSVQSHLTDTLANQITGLHHRNQAKDLESYSLDFCIRNQTKAEGIVGYVELLRQPVILVSTERGTDVPYDPVGFGDACNLSLRRGRADEVYRGHYVCLLADVSREIDGA